MAPVGTCHPRGQRHMNRADPMDQQDAEACWPNRTLRDGQHQRRGCRDLDDLRASQVKAPPKPVGAAVWDLRAADAAAEVVVARAALGVDEEPPLLASVLLHLFVFQRQVRRYIDVHILWEAL